MNWNAHELGEAGLAFVECEEDSAVAAAVALF
jgi:hypothetical protein